MSNIIPPGRYIHLTPEGWEADPLSKKKLNVEQAYIQARRQFKSNTKNVDPAIFQKVMEILSQETQLKGQLGDFIQQLDGLRRGGKAIHAHDIKVGGLTTSLYKLGFAKKDGDAIPNFIKALERSLTPGGKSLQLARAIEKIIKYIDSFGEFQGGRHYVGKDGVGKIRVGGANGATFVDLKECSQIQGAYKKLVNVKNQAKAGGLTAEALQNLTKELQSVGRTFVRNFAGAVNEFTKVAETQAVLNLKENINKFVTGFGMTNVHFEVNQIGASHIEGNSGTKRVSKGDTEIIMTYDLNGVNGTWRTTISEKSGPLGVISKYNKNKEFHGNLVGGGTYETIFEGVGWQVEKLFCNVYMHESVQNDTPLMSFIGARAASNIISGSSGEGQAMILRENHMLTSIEELFNTIIKNKNNIDRYINLRVDPVTPNSNVLSKNKRVENSSNDDQESLQAAQDRSQEVYKAIRDSVHFYANLGSRRGFGSIKR